MAGKKRKPKKWRQFEIAVSQLEALLQPTGFKLTSPDQLLDGDTGELREVDCSIRDHHDVPILVLECRRRKKKQDVMWIEQLACKRDSLGLSSIIAVSSNGFSKPATVKAPKRGVTLRTFADIVTPAVVEQFHKDLQVRHISRTVRLLQFDFEVDNDCPELSDETIQAFRAAIEAGEASATILKNHHTGEDVTVDELLNACLLRATGLKPGLNRKKMRLSFSPRTFLLGSTPLTLFLLSAIVTMEVAVIERTLDDLALQQYAQGDEILLEVASADITSARHGPLSFRVVFTREPESSSG